ncbi:Mu-like prophage major head subunit gpT family protein [Methylococcus capsulatus]|uniref:Mu-like prophage major head subunit gpT family protein n=1 Tax=Methylococcus capsulatus TaxID=414 RepID=UPI002FDA5037
MKVGSPQLDALRTGFNSSFQKGYAGAPSHWASVAMKINSSNASETYGWMGQLPSLREWIGDRVIKNLAEHSYSVKNRKFETTITVQRADIEDDRIGLYAPLFQELGRAAAEHPDELVFGLMAAGFATPCYDGQYFFDTDHPVGRPDGSTISVSNFGGGTGTAWYLLDTSRPMKPMIFQERIPYALQRVDNDQNERVFLRDEYLFGVRARVNAGFGLWQLAYASKRPLDATNYAAARVAMASLTSDEGRPLGIRPDTLVVPPALEQQALQLIQNELLINAGVAVSNEWKGTAKLIVMPWLS